MLGGIMPEDVNATSSVATDSEGNVIVDIEEGTQEPVDDKGVPIRNREAEMERLQGRIDTLQAQMATARTAPQKEEIQDKIDYEKQRYNIAKELGWKLSDDTGDVDMDDFNRHAKLSGEVASAITAPFKKEIDDLKQQIEEMRFESRNSDFMNNRAQIDTFIDEHPNLSKLKGTVPKTQLYSIALEIMNTKSEKPSPNQARIINRQNVSSTVSTKPKRQVSLTPREMEAAKAAGISPQDWAKRKG